MAKSRKRSAIAAFAAGLRLARVRAGYKTARSLAIRLGIQENRYTRFERGAAEPDFSLIAQICDVLEVTPNELFGIGAAAAGFAERGQPSLAPQVEPRDVPRAVREPGASPSAHAAWRLASDIERARRKLAGGGAADEGLAAVRETTTLYEELMAAPYAAIGRIAADPVLAAASRKSSIALRKQIDQFVAAVSREAVSHE